MRMCNRKGVFDSSLATCCRLTSHKTLFSALLPPGRFINSSLVSMAVKSRPCLTPFKDLAWCASLPLLPPVPPPPGKSLPADEEVAVSAPEPVPCVPLPRFSRLASRNLVQNTWQRRVTTLPLLPDSPSSHDEMHAQLCLGQQTGMARRKEGVIDGLQREGIFTGWL